MTSKNSRTKSSSREKARDRAMEYQRVLRRRYWRRFLGYVGEDRGRLTVLLFLIFLTAFFEVLLPQIVRVVLDWIVPRKDTTLLTWIILGGAACYFLHAAFRFWEQKRIVQFSLGLMNRIRRDLFAFQWSLPLEYFSRIGPGKLISKMTYSTTMIRLLVESFAYTCLREIVLIVLIVVAAAFLDFKLTLIFLMLAPGVWLYIRRLNRLMSELASQLQTKNDQIVKLLHGAYNSVKVYRVFGNPQKETERLARLLGEDLHFRVKRTMLYAGNTIVVYLLSGLVVLAALWYGAHQIMTGHMTQGEAMAYIIYLGMLLYPVKELIRASAFLQAGKIGVYTVFSVFERETPIAESPHPMIPAQVEGRITFRNVWFRYHRGASALRHFNLEVKAGQKVLIVGPSGSGKSTLFNLLLRLCEPERGSILIDGVPIPRMRLKQLRECFSVVLQEDLHVEDSIMENVFLNDNPSWETKVEGTLDWIRQAGLDRNITRRDKKLGAEVGAGGLGFSRGEMQKIALLRAANRDAPIVLLDEPTASMDIPAERKALAQLDSWFGGKTMLMISHRPVPSFKADWIVVMKNGKLEAQGNHFYLLSHSEYYRNLVRNPAPDEPKLATPAGDGPA